MFGARRAFDMCMAIGGQRVFVPASGKHTRKGQLHRAVTRKEARRLTDDYGGMNIKFPIAREFCISFLYWVEARNSPEIARLLRISTDAVDRNIARAHPLLSGLPIVKKEDRARVRKEQAQRVHLKKQTVFEQLGLSPEDVQRYNSQTTEHFA